MAAAADDPWLVVGRRGRARPAAAARQPARHAPLAGDDDADAAAPPAPSDEEAAAARLSSGRTPATSARTTAPDYLAAAVAAWEAPIASAGWWAGLARAMAAATRAAGAAVEEQERGEGSSHHRRLFSWEQVAGLLVLGLGSLEGPAPGPARAQAALARLLARHLRGLKGGESPPSFRLVAADPVFTPADGAALGRLGFEVLPPGDALAVLRANKGGGPPPAAWVAYLPHCEPGLTEAVLGAAGVGGKGENASAASTLALLGNSFAALADRWACALPNGRGGGRARLADPHDSARPGVALGLAEAGRVVEVDLVAVSGGGGGGAAATTTTTDRAHAPTLAAAFGDTALHLFLPLQ